MGNRSLLPRMGVIAPEGAVEWVDRELEILPTRPQDRFSVDPEQIEELRQEVFPYWRGKTLEDVVADRVPDDVRRAVEAKAFSLNQTDHAQGHILPDVEGWLRLGIGGLARKGAGGPRARARDADACARGLLPRPPRSLCWQPRPLSSAMPTWRDEQAEQEADPARRQELDEIADRLRLVGRTPGAQFLERRCRRPGSSLCLLQIESNASSFSPGRLDQILLPYLERDLARGPLDAGAGAGTAGMPVAQVQRGGACCAAAPARATLPGFRSGLTSSWAGSSPMGGTRPTC